MSNITITFETQALDFSPLTRGVVTVVFNNGSQNIPLNLSLTTSVATTGFFQEVAWIDGSSDEDNQQALNFRNSFNAAFTNIGGTKNLVASVSGNTLTITATIGTFVDAVGDDIYTGNVITVEIQTKSNVAVPPVPNISATITTTGDCSLATYNFVATGEGNPFVVKRNNTDLITDWGGTSSPLSVPRGVGSKYVLHNSSGTAIAETTIYAPRKLAEGDFSIDITGFETSSDILVNRDIVIANTGPLTYSLDETTESSGTNYVTINSFTGVADGQYRLFVKDVFGCEIFKTINVSSNEDNIKNSPVKYFQIMEGQSLIFNEFVEFNSQIKKNYFNTGSYNESVNGQRYHTKHYFSGNDEYKGIQFKSSYSHHAITLHHRDGTMVDIPPIMISQNLGVLEKMDCQRFSLTETTTGVYFNGGNIYTPDTTTVIGTNTYVGTTPAWAKVGQLVYLDGSGLRITSTGYDASYGWYFVVDATTGTDQAATVQLTYNKHDYNTFEFYFDTSIIEDCDVIVVEKGFALNVYDGNQWVSERIYNLVDTDKYLLIKWSDLKNRSDIVFQSGIEFMTRLEGEFIADSDDSSETYSGDSNEYSIEQIRRLNFEVFIEGISFKQVMQLNIASALEGFSVNGLNLVCKSAPEKKRYDKSNLWSWRGKFAYGKNLVAVQQDEIVLSVGTGVVGGGGTGKTAYPDLQGITLITDQDGNIFMMDGVLIKQ